jgi:hypothetical protein
VNAGDAAKRIGQLLEQDGIDYAIGGALALGVWGAPRGTKDVDLSVFVMPQEFERVADVFERAGVMFDRTAAAADISRTGLFRGRLGRVPIDAFISAHPHFLEMQTRRRAVKDVDGTTLYFISAEDLCVMKLVYGRGKDLADLERLFAVRTIDTAYVRSWLARMPVGEDRVATLDDLERRFGGHEKL